MGGGFVKDIAACQTRSQTSKGSHCCLFGNVPVIAHFWTIQWFPGCCAQAWNCWRPFPTSMRQYKSNRDILVDLKHENSPAVNCPRLPACPDFSWSLFQEDQNLGQMIQGLKKEIPVSLTLKLSPISFLHEMSYNFCPPRSQRGDRPQLYKT